MELPKVFVSLNKRPHFWKSLSKIISIIFHWRTSIITKQRKLVLLSKIYFKVYTYLNYCSRLFLDFWLCIKGNQVYYTWITYTSVLLVSIQLLFSHCAKYAEIRVSSDPYFPESAQNHIHIFRKDNFGKIQIWFYPYTEKNGSNKARISAYLTQYLAEHFDSWLRPTRKHKFC